jgi:putative membrane protein
MHIAAKILIVVLAALHIFFMVLEMFFWTTPYGNKAFGTTPEGALASATLAANQGLYNGFLAAGLIWGLLQDASTGKPIVMFFVICVLVAGLYGGFTANRSILFVQALPALLTLGALFMG